MLENVLYLALCGGYKDVSMYNPSSSCPFQIYALHYVIVS